MGTDIHCFVEKRDDQGYWKAVAGPNPRIDRYKMYAEWSKERDEEDSATNYEKESADIASGERYRRSGDDWDAPKVYQGWIYDNRNYDVFAILADVRNGYGFAGVKRGDGFNPIDTPRGYAEDMSSEAQDYLDDWTHSASWLTLRDLLEYDWNQVTGHQGVVGVEQYKVWKEKGKPESWSGGVSGGNVIHITNTEMDMLINGEYVIDPDKSYYTTVHWDEVYADSASDFYPRVPDELKKLSESTDGEDVRLVFGFDS